MRVTSVSLQVECDGLGGLGHPLARFLHTAACQNMEQPPDRVMQHHAWKGNSGLYIYALPRGWGICSSLWRPAGSCSHMGKTTQRFQALLILREFRLVCTSLRSKSTYPGRNLDSVWAWTCLNALWLPPPWDPCPSLRTTSHWGQCTRVLKRRFQCQTLQVKSLAPCKSYPLVI